jgi:hypothetical protein
MPVLRAESGQRALVRAPLNKLLEFLSALKLRVAIVPVVIRKEESSLVGRDIIRLLLFSQSREKQQRLHVESPRERGHTSAPAHFNLQH